MIRRLFLFFIGYVCAEVSERDVKELTRALFDLGLSVFIGRKKRKKTRIITYRKNDREIIRKTAEEFGIKLLNERFYGVPEIWRRYGKRWGLLVGILLFFTAMIFANDFVWRIEISGNENVTDEKIIEELDALGFRLGVRYDDVDFDILHNRFLKDSEDIAWIAVNMRGSVAYVEVKEFLPDGEKEDGGCANIIASEDGIITQVSAFRGSPEVSIGDEVKKGQLLISGVVPYEGKNTEFVYAKGEVYAEITKVIEVRVPLLHEVKTFDDEKTDGYGIKFFGREIFFGGKGRIDSTFYDTITMYKDLSVPGCAPLPIEIIKVGHIPYRVVTEEMTVEEASAIAYAEYKNAFIDATKGVTLLSYDMAGAMSLTNDAYVITSTLRVIKNIAETQEFDIE